MATWVTVESGICGVCGTRNGVVLCTDCTRYRCLEHRRISSLLFNRAHSC